MIILLMTLFKVFDIYRSWFEILRLSHKLIQKMHGANFPSNWVCFWEKESKSKWERKKWSEDFRMIMKMLKYAFFIIQMSKNKRLEIIIFSGWNCYCHLKIPETQTLKRCKRKRNNKNEMDCWMGKSEFIARVSPHRLTQYF